MNADYHALEEAQSGKPTGVPLRRSYAAQKWMALAVLIFTALLFAATRSLVLREEEVLTFQEYYHRFGRDAEYSVNSPEYYRRSRIYYQNTQFIRNHNSIHQDVKLKPNQFMDLEWSEFKHRHLAGVLQRPNGFGYGLDGSLAPPPQETHRETADFLSHIANITLPKQVNWIDKGCVTPVKDQAHCGSCWAFSTTGALEGAICAQTGQLISLSEQQLVDCARPEGTAGCHGGFMDRAMQYVIDNDGLCLEDDYPYVGRDGEECRASQCKVAAKVRSIIDLPASDDKALRAAIAFFGPVSVALEADRPVFQFYHKGVLEVKCGKHLNHAVLAVGYGREADGRHYWLIKNSWGPTWGDEGYIKLTRDHHKKVGECGVLLAPVVPVIRTDW